MAPEISSLTEFLFIALVVFLFAAIIFGVSFALKKINSKSRARKIISLALLIFVWLLFLAILSTNHILDNWGAMPPRMIIVILPPLITAILLLFSKSFSEILNQIPQTWLITIQSFRIAMEIILLMLFFENIIPKQMTFEGLNFDILAGVSALVVGHFVSRNTMPNKLILVWNVVCLLLLANIVSIALLSAPLPFRVFTNEPANTVIAYFPFVWLPGFVVPVAYAMHFFSIKKCWAKKIAPEAGES